MEKTYLGDSVYAEVDVVGVKIYTDNGYGPTNEIFLEPEVYEALVIFADQVFEKGVE